MHHVVPYSTKPGLLRLPDELLEAIVRHLGPADTIAFANTCKHADKVATSPLIWRRHCVETWNGWHARHGLTEKLSLPPTQTDWRQLFNERTRTDRNMLALFGEMLSTQRCRYQRIEQIAAHGLDVTDFLTRLKTESPDSAPDVLARRYYANAILGQIRRAGAVDTWMRLARGDEIKLEEALGAYELFVFPESRFEAGDLSSELDGIAQRIRSSQEDFDGMPVRQKAIMTAEFLRSENLLGMSVETEYHALKNNFLSTAFTEHSSLPLQSTAIYCAVAQRLGINAMPSNYPQHVYTVIEAPRGITLDGVARDRESSLDAEQEYMYMDPWRSSEEVPVDQLRLRLSQIGISREEQRNYGPASVIEMTIRTGRNIMVSVEEARHRAVNDPVFPDLEAAWYSMLWVMVVLGDSDDRAAFTRRRQFIPYLVQHFQAHAPEDIPLVDLIPPLFEVEREHRVLMDMLTASRVEDMAERTAKPRDAANPSVQYKIGHYFRHRRYQYDGFIIGWDVQCAATRRWISQMRVDDLPRGRDQPFYHIVADDKSTRYVAEENIEILHEPPFGTLIDMAGRYFKRWNAGENKFGSNILDDYPDD
ncbi:putative Hemimethylated DNA-binding protein YccV like-domain-containing protein [Seiridium unicorne]|uniref:Hemimethylated DNA-binding protein YccV like-domain-containing protein n=1 Tax=Seiridium unicorne TaxID=138068 RepID=A0ABR2V0Y5_9PEZI